MKRTRKKPVWPWNKPIPAFKTEEEEIAFWDSHQFEPPPDDVGRELVPAGRSTRRVRTHVYRLRLSEEELALVQGRAKQRGVPMSVVLRELVRRLGN